LFRRALAACAVEVLQEATRLIIVRLSFRTIDAHFKYLLAAGLMDNSSLRKIFIVNPNAGRFLPQIRNRRI